MKKKMIFLIMIMLLGICAYTNIYAESVDEVLNPLQGQIEENVTSLTTVIFIILGIFAIIAIIEKIILDIKKESIKIYSNKGIRILEVLFLIILLILLGYEYIRIENIVIKVIGLVLCLFTFYQRVSNKNRKFAYITLTIDMLLYIGINIFS